MKTPPCYHAGATFSECGRYRYRLVRRWDASNLSDVCWVMLNPSTADARDDDATTRRCIGFSRAWGHGGLVVVNLFAWRATNPHELVKAHRRGEDIVGHGGDAAIIGCARGSGPVVCAWGAHDLALRTGRARAVLELINSADADAKVLRLTSSGSPAHPLRQRGDLVLQLWGAT